MPDDHDPRPSFDVKLSLILMAIIATCFIGYRIAHGGPRPQDVPCAPGQATLTDCNKDMAADREGNASIAGAPAGAALK